MLSQIKPRLLTERRAKEELRGLLKLFRGVSTRLKVKKDGCFNPVPPRGKARKAQFLTFDLTNEAQRVLFSNDSRMLQPLRRPQKRRYCCFSEVEKGPCFQACFAKSY